MTQQSTLRGLAKAYANGALDKEKYRRDRTAYIEGVLSGEIAIKAAQPAAPARPKTDRANETFGDDTGRILGTAINSEPVDTSNTSEPGPFNSRTGMIIGGAVLLIIVIIVLMVMPDSKETVPQPQGQATANVPVLDAPPATIAQNLINSFLAKNTWSEASINAFLSEWEVMPEPEKTSIRNTIELSQLTNAIYKKLLEERALSGIGNPETSYEKQRQLVQFADSLGISDPRISLPEQAGETPTETETQDINNL